MTVQFCDSWPFCCDKKSIRIDRPGVCARHLPQVDGGTIRVLVVVQVKHELGVRGIVDAEDLSTPAHWNDHPALGLVPVLLLKCDT